MKVKITQSFVEVNTVPFRVGDVLDVPVAADAEWIRLGRAVSLEPHSLESAVEHPDPKAAKLKPEHAIKPKPETRSARNSARGGVGRE